MSNLVPSNNDKAALYVQSVEKQQDTLVLRKKIAHELWLTSIGEFIEWRAVANKDGRWRLVNEQWEYMRDPMIKNLIEKRKDLWPRWYVGFNIQKWFFNGNETLVEKEEDNTDIIESHKWIFSAKDGIIIVVDDRNYGHWSRFYTVEWKPIQIPLRWDIDNFSVADRWDNYSVRDDFRRLHNYFPNQTDLNSMLFDRRKNIVNGMIAIHIAWKTRMDKPEHMVRDIEKSHNLFNNCAYNLLQKNGEFFKTSLGEYYANSKKSFDWSCGLMPCIHGGISDGTVRTDEQYENTKRKRPVFYAVNMQWQVFKDEFGNIVMFDDPYWLNNFDKEWFAPIVIDKTISPIRLGGDSPHPYTEYGAYICFINTAGQYRKSSDGKVTIIPFYKTQREYTVTSNDVRGYKLYPEYWIIEVRQLSITEPWFRWVNKEIYKLYDYHGNEVQKHKYFNYAAQPKWMENINWGETDDRIYKDISDDIIAYGEGTRTDIYGDWSEFSYGGKTKLVNKKIGYKQIKFPDGEDEFLIDLDREIEGFSKWYILHDHLSAPVEYPWKNGKLIQQSYAYAHIKINGLVARYTKDEEGRELNLINHMVVSMDQKYLFVQRKDWDPYCILNQSFAYIKDNNWNKLQFPRPPFYVDGMFLLYDIAPGQENNFQKDCELAKAYFEDGTLVGDQSFTIDTRANIGIVGKWDIYKALK